MTEHQEVCIFRQPKYHIKNNVHFSEYIFKGLNKPLDESFNIVKGP